MVPAGFMRIADVEARLIEAMEVLLRSPDREGGWIGSRGSSIWRMVQDDLSEAAPDDRPIVTCAFTRQQQDRATEALGWVAKWVPAGTTRKVVARVLIAHVLDDDARVDWSDVWMRMGGAPSGWTTEGLRKRYGRALTVICNALNARRSAA